MCIRDRGKYKAWLEPDNLLRLQAWARNGLTDEQIAHNVGIAVGTCLLYTSILDALKAGTIYDVKYLNKSMGSAELAWKYLESAQHPAYFYIVPEAHEFKYLVSDGKDLYIEQYPR